MKFSYVIYKLTFPNGKIYIGKDTAMDKSGANEAAIDQVIEDKGLSVIAGIAIISPNKVVR